MEIERKYLIEQPPENHKTYPCHFIEQAYLSVEPVVRVRRQDNDYYLTYKSKGLMVREEYNLPLTKESYEHLLSKADGKILTKKRYLLPIPESSLIIELDVFEGGYEGLVLAEVEFSTQEEAECFLPPDWFTEDVTFSGAYQNSRLAMKRFDSF